MATRRNIDTDYIKMRLRK